MKNAKSFMEVGLMTVPTYINANTNKHTKDTSIVMSTVPRAKSVSMKGSSSRIFSSTWRNLRSVRWKEKRGQRKREVALYRVLMKVDVSMGRVCVRTRKLGS
jgi:hypothetical protein